MKTIRQYREEVNAEKDRLFDLKYPDGQFKLARVYASDFHLQWQKHRRLPSGFASVRRHTARDGTSRLIFGGCIANRRAVNYATLAGLLAAAERKGVDKELTAAFVKRHSEESK
jgi:hypothetical protein